MKKRCFRCNRKKPLDEFYAHPQMADKHLGKCKRCTRKDAASRISRLKQDPVWVEKERERCREKSGQIRIKNPQLSRMQNAIQILPRIPKFQLHHWSYAEENWFNIVPLCVSDHRLLHRYLYYDDNEQMFRNIYGGLVDSARETLIYLGHIKRRKIGEK